MGWQPETQPKGKPPVEKTKGSETMQRLIDADALITAVLRNAIDYAVVFGDSEMHRLLVQVIAHQPTIDAEPVRHGKWIGYAGTIGNECSVCGKWIDVLQGTAEMNYCPNCGARMDGERKEE